MNSNREPLPPVLAGYLRLLPLLPFFYILCWNSVDIFYLRSAGYSFYNIVLNLPEFVFSSILLQIGLSLFCIRRHTTRAAVLLFVGIMFQFLAELEECDVPDYSSLGLFTLLLLFAGAISIPTNLLTNKPKKDFGMLEWTILSVFSATTLIFTGHEMYFYLAWHLPLYSSLIYFAHLVSVPQWLSYDDEIQHLSLRTRRSRVKILILWLSQILIPSTILLAFSDGDLPAEITFLRILPLLLLLVSTLSPKRIPVACLIASLIWMVDLIYRLSNNRATIHIAAENIALMSSSLICFGYTTSVDVILPLRNYLGSSSF